MKLSIKQHNYLKKLRKLRDKEYGERGRFVANFNWKEMNKIIRAKIPVEFAYENKWESAKEIIKRYKKVAKK